MFDTKVSSSLNQGRFGTIEEIRKAGAMVDYEKGIAEAAGVTMISDGKTARVLDDDGFYFVVGGTGSKKTRNVVAPFIYNNALAGNSMIVTDIKGDLYKIMSSRLRQLGYRIIVLDFNEPDKGDAYNPLASIYRDYKGGRADKASRELNNLSDIIFSAVESEKDPFWHTTASSYFSGCELTIFDLFDEKDATIENALNIHIQGQKRFGMSNFIREYYRDKETMVAWKLLASTVEAPNETRSSIQSVYTSALNRLIGQNKGLIRMMSHSTFEIEDLIDEKAAIFLISNEESLSAHSGLITALIQHWYDQLVSTADQGDGVLPRNVVFVLDEFGNLPAIKDFQMKISLSRARGISWMIALQSFAQLTLRYGEDAAKTIIGNTANWIYLFSPDPELLTYISDLCGEVADEYTGQIRKLLSVSQLRHFQKLNEDGLTECLMLLGRMNPFVSYLPDISQYYGIEPLTQIDISYREKEEIETIDFIGIVKRSKQEAMRQMIGNEKNSDEEKKPVAEDTVNRNELRDRVKNTVDATIAALAGGDRDAQE